MRAVGPSASLTQRRCGFDASTSHSRTCTASSSVSSSPLHPRDETQVSQHMRSEVAEEEPPPPPRPDCHTRLVGDRSSRSVKHDVTQDFTVQ